MRSYIINLQIVYECIMLVHAVVSLDTRFSVGHVRYAD